MWVSAAILLLLWAINFTPPFLAFLLNDRWGGALDGGRLWRDGEAVFGPHKTVRGVVGAVTTGMVGAVSLGFPWWLGMASALLSMAGDLLSSFIKRRLRFTSGGLAPGLDQAFEGLFPYLVLAPYFSLSARHVAALWLFFGLGAFAGSRFLKVTLLKEPYENYPRPLRCDIRMREWRSCHIHSDPLCYMFNFERALYYHFIMKNAFRLLGVYELGRANALKIERKNVDLYFPDLPLGFDGYTILFLSDLHIDGLDGITEKLLEVLGELSVDLCILGGDLRMETFGSFHEALRLLGDVIPSLRAADGVYAILGNHDCPDIITPLMERGVKFLVNEAAPISRNGDTLWLLGVDDTHYYRCHDLEKASEEVPAGAFTVLAAHSPEIYAEASGFGIRLYLCGHTHGGQIRLPRLGPVFTHAKAPRRMAAGQWEHGAMTGYTTSGVGVSGVPVRFFSKGEVSVITLRRGKAGAGGLQAN